MSNLQINIHTTDYDTQNGSILTVHWTCSKSEDGYTASGYGAEGFTPDPDSPDFIPFDQLTEQDVIGWLEAKEGWKEDLEARLDADIERQKNPPVLSGLPWTEVETEASE